MNSACQRLRFGKAPGERSTPLPWTGSASLPSRRYLEYADLTALFRVTSGELGEGRDLFRGYLYLCLLANLPYDQVVKEMVTASARSNWLEGPVNYLARDHVDDFNDILINQEDTYYYYVKLVLTSAVSLRTLRGHERKTTPSV